MATTTRIIGKNNQTETIGVTLMLIYSAKQWIIKVGSCRAPYIPAIPSTDRLKPHL